MAKIPTHSHAGTSALRTPVRFSRARCTRLALAAAIWAGLTGGSAAAQNPLQNLRSPGRPESDLVKARMAVDRTALLPGTTIRAAIELEVKEGWHIYWPNRGEGGLETVVRWDLPPGFQAGPTLFPPPQRHVDSTDAHTFVMYGRVVLLTEISVPQDLQGAEEVELAARIDWLACREVCVKGDNQVRVSLPVATTAEQARPDNNALFEAAEARLPRPAGRAEHLKNLSAAADVDAVRPGSRFHVAVVIEVADGHHINAHMPLHKALIPTDVFPFKTEGVEWDRPEFPPGIEEKSPFEEGRVAVYRGRVIALLPATADAGLSGTQIELGGVVTYQACSDQTGQCFMPASARWNLTLPVAADDRPPRPANQELFAAARAQAGRSPVPDQAPTLEGAGVLLRLQTMLAGWGFAGYVLLALAGGFIMNLMPCVLPVISIKVLSFVQQARESRLRVLTLGLAFAAGMEVSFLVLGALIVGAGQQWGGQFQHPWLVITLAAVVTALALSLFGVFSVFPPRLVNDLGERIRGEGHLSSFGMGLLATLLGTACTAPFLSFVVAIAARMSALQGMTIFALAGLGMALPYVLLAAQPAWVALIPRPGPWMAVFERFVGFCLLFTVVWLISPLAGVMGGDGLLRVVLFLVFVGMAAWLYGLMPYGASGLRRLATWAAVAACLGAGGLLSFRVLVPPERPADAIPWEPYSRQRALEAATAGTTVFIDYTADWCVNCKVNERLVIDTPEVRAAIRRLGVLPMKADFTLPDEEIRQDLERHGRSGVPMYLILPAGRPQEAIVLPEILTRSLLIDALEQAGPPRPPAPVVGAGD